MSLYNNCLGINFWLYVHLQPELIPDPIGVCNLRASLPRWIWDQELMMYKRQGVQVSQYCIPLYVSYDGKPSDRAFAGLLVFSGQE